MSDLEKCGSNSCIFGPPSGIGTNGPCRCIPKHKEFYDKETAFKLSGNVQILNGKTCAREEQLREMAEFVEYLRCIHGYNYGVEVGFDKAKQILEEMK